MKSDPVYCYPPDHTVLRNLPGIQDPDELRRFERLATRIRAREGLPTGDFDLPHLKAVHRHLFQDVYTWAGEIRQVEIEKGGTEFGYQQMIEPEMTAVHRRLEAVNRLRGLGRREFAGEAARIMGDVNYIHPFRDGNGRTQLIYLKQLGAQAGHDLDLARLRREPWIEASRAASGARPDFQPMAACIEDAISHDRSRGAGQARPRADAKAAPRHERFLEQARLRAARPCKDWDRDR